MPRKRTERGERKIEKRAVGPYWRPGEDHPLDVLDNELQETRDQLPGLLEELLSAAQRTQIRLQSILDAEQANPDPEAPYTAADLVARRMIVDRFHNRKHLHHLTTLFMLQRRKRLLGRLRTIQAALDLVNNLLDEEETLSQEFLSSWSQAQATDTTSDKEEEPQAKPTREELRVQGLAEPLEPILSSVDQSRRLLRNFEAQLPDLRRQLASGRGWFEVFYVPKRHYKESVIAYAKALEVSQKRGIPIPQKIIDAIHPEVAKLIRAGSETFPKQLRLEVYDIVNVGPYVKYRWKEQKQIYTISLGLDDDYPPFPFVPEGF
jgi:hypothetical protein